MRYILDLYLSRINEIEMRNPALFTLCQLAKSKELSTYEICNSLKSTEYKADYKNVHKKIQRFCKSGFIVKTKIDHRQHSAVYYRLTSLGIIGILYHLHGKTAIFRSELHDMINGMLTYYGEDDFFNFFIYPFFEKNTLMKIKSDMVVEFIVNYCTESAHKLMSKLYEGKLIDEHNKFASKEKIKKWLSEMENALKANLDNSSLLEKEQLERNTNNNIFDNIRYELGFDKVTILENTMIFPIISQGRYKASKIVGFEHSPSYKRNWGMIEKDVSLLVNDRNFYNMLVTTKNGFDNCYNSIIRCKYS